jgi:hypothetical protein
MFRVTYRSLRNGPRDVACSPCLEAAVFGGKLKTVEIEMRMQLFSQFFTHLPRVHLVHRASINVMLSNRPHRRSCQSDIVICISLKMLIMSRT